MWPAGATGPETTDEAVRRLLGVVGSRLRQEAPTEAVSLEAVRSVARDVLPAAEEASLRGLVLGRCPKPLPGETREAYVARLCEGGGR